MSGIVGYIGSHDAVRNVLAGMRRFEHRWYDSAGIAWLDTDGLQSAKIIGGVSQFEKQLSEHKHTVQIAIGHTRWATHGSVSLKNAHPHFDTKHQIAIVHKGVVENEQLLREWLAKRGHFFVSETDSELIAHCISELNHGDLLEAVRLTCRLLSGSFSLAVVSAKESHRIIAARRGQPLVIGSGDAEHIIASAPDAVMSVTRQVTYMDDDQIADVRANGFSLYSIGAKTHLAELDAIHDEFEFIAEQQGFETPLLQELYEQPKIVEQVLRGRLRMNGELGIEMPGLESSVHQLLSYNRLIITASGASWHASIVGKYILEELLGVSVALEYAPEFRYRNIPIDQSALLIAVSHTGEDPDTVAALAKAHDAGMMTLGMTNVPGSRISKETDCGMHLRIGSERGISPIKVFTAEVMAFSLLGMYLARKQGFSIDPKMYTECGLIADKMQTTIVRTAQQCEALAARYATVDDFLFVGQGYGLPVVLEAGAKFRQLAHKKVAFYHGSEQTKKDHVVEPGMPVFAIIDHTDAYAASVATLTDIRDKGGEIIAIVPEYDDTLASIAREVLSVPTTLNIMSPLLTCLPLQLLAYYIARDQGLALE